MSKVDEFEKNKNWQATAQPCLVAIMKGQPGGEFEGKYYLYDETFAAPAPSGMPVPAPAGAPMRAHSADEIKAKFSSGELCLVRGTIPE